MSQLLQLHINQRLMKSQSGENSPQSPGGIGSPGALSPLSMGPSSPQGMPIPRRSVNETPHWIFNPAPLLSNTSYMPGMAMTWNGMSLLDSGTEAMDMNTSGSEFDQMGMEGVELSKLSMAVDEDDIFKVERDDDVYGPTLAELNAPDADTLLDGLNFDDLYWPAETLPPVEATPSPQTPGCATTLDTDDLVPYPFQVYPSSSCPQIGVLHRYHNFTGDSVPVSSNILESALLQPIAVTSDLNFMQNTQSTMTSVPPSTPQATSSSSGGGLRELLLRRELQNSMDATSPDPVPLGQSLPRSILDVSSGSLSPRLSSSAPTANSPWETWQQRREAVWSRRDPRPHLISTGSLAEAGSTSSLISTDVLSPGREISLSMDEGFDSDELSDRDSSDEDSDGSDTESNAESSIGNRREKFFWQYNVQSKGPKGQRLALTPTQEDPHVLQRPTDPVFSPHCHIQGIKHSGKARKGDGNDLTPNPRKLSTIGKELDRLNRVIGDMTPVADVPSSIKSRSRKEKNKLASRACRLKKKAQHEANKLKLYGLEQEHKRLMSSIDQARQAVFTKMDEPTSDLSEPLVTKIERISKAGTRYRIGGHTTEFVNRVLEKVKQGVPDGGIGDL